MAGQRSTHRWRAGGWNKWVPEVGCHHGKTILEQAPGRTCSPTERGDCVGAGLLTGLMTLWVTLLEQFVPAGLCPMEWPRVGAVGEELQSVGRTQAEFMEHCLLWEEPCAGGGCGVIPLRQNEQ